MWWENDQTIRRLLPMISKLCILLKKSVLLFDRFEELKDLQIKKIVRYFFIFMQTLFTIKVSNFALSFRLCLFIPCLQW